MIISDANYLHFRLFVINPLQTFVEYASYIEISLENKLKEFEKEIQNIEESEVDEYIDFYYDEISQYRDDFPAIMRNSLFISIYSFLEDKVVELCVPSEVGLQLDDLKGKGIQQASLYIKKVLQKDFPDQSKEWHFIKKANLIRNCIVHNGGDIKKLKNPTKVLNAVNDLEHVSINQHEEIILDKYFCIEFILIAQEFLQKLYKVEYPE